MSARRLQLPVRRGADFRPQILLSWVPSGQEQVHRDSISNNSNSICDNNDSKIRMGFYVLLLCMFGLWAAGRRVASSIRVCFISTGPHCSGSRVFRCGLVGLLVVYAFERLEVKVQS